MRYPNGKLALDGVDLTVRAGELVTILGSNGSGKTTLLRCIARLLDPTEGEVLVGGQDLARLNGEALREARLALAMVFQRANLVRRRSVLANVASGTLGRRRTLWTTLGGLPAEELPLARELLRKVGVERLGGQRADTLSGGQAQRAAIARALAQRPKLILADEPVASLDPEAAEEIMRLLRQLAVEERPGGAVRAAPAGARSALFASRRRPARRRRRLRPSRRSLRRPADRAALQGSRRMSVDGTALDVAPRARALKHGARRRARPGEGRLGRRLCASSLALIVAGDRRAVVLCRAGAPGGPDHRRPRHGRHAQPRHAAGLVGVRRHRCGRRWRRSTWRSSAPCSAC